MTRKGSGGTYKLDSGVEASVFGLVAGAGQSLSWGKRNWGTQAQDPGAKAVHRPQWEVATVRVCLQDR